MTLEQIVALALAEDIGSGDLTASLLPDKRAQAVILSQQEALFCGKAFATAAFQQVDPKIVCDWQIADGDPMVSGQTLCRLAGPLRSLLTAERTALNFLQVLSSTATLTQLFVRKLQGTNTKLLDTRKTLPGLRRAQKYAVTCGGGNNHRYGLYDAILIKENHIAAYGSLEQLIIAAKKYHKPIEVEVRNLTELQQVLPLEVAIVMLDNFSLEEIRQAVVINAGKVKLEVSGGVNLENIQELAATGVDYISVGAITKTVIPIELTMLMEDLVAL